MGFCEEVTAGIKDNCAYFMITPPWCIDTIDRSERGCEEDEQ
jgi:hypothetical protein